MNTDQAINTEFEGGTMEMREVKPKRPKDLFFIE